MMLLRAVNHTKFVLNILKMIFRVRRENRRFSDSDRGSATFATNELIRALTKTPTRSIPSANGIILPYHLLDDDNLYFKCRF